MGRPGDSMNNLHAWIDLQLLLQMVQHSLPTKMYIYIKFKRCLLRKKNVGKKYLNNMSLKHKHLKFLPTLHDLTNTGSTKNKTYVFVTSAVLLVWTCFICSHV